MSERFWAKVEITDGCWFWQGTLSKHGYGSFSEGGRTVRAHRWAYEKVVGPIPAGLVIDHLCRVRHCVNPAHMEPVTPGENTRRGAAAGTFGAANRSKTHCPQGHPYEGENTYDSGDGFRRCRICRNARVRRRYHEVKRLSEAGERP